jgi:carboxymethylenebutenolidase
VEDRDKLGAELKLLGKDYLFFTYEGAGHVFIDHTNPERYQEESAKLAWPRTLEFLDKHLKGALVSS